MSMPLKSFDKRGQKKDETYDTNLIGDFPRQEQYLLGLSALIPKDQ